MPDDPDHETNFVPDPGNTRLLRDAFGCFATGVTVVTAMAEGGVVAITVNSFSSVSLTPPLVLWSPSRTAERFEYFVQARNFAIHILSSEQEDLCWRASEDACGLRDLDLAMNPEGVPILGGCLARFDCERYAIHEGGDHAIVLGRVRRVQMREGGSALAFYKGRIGRFDAL